LPHAGRFRAPSSRTSGGSARRWRCVGLCRRSCRPSAEAARLRRERPRRNICLGRALTSAFRKGLFDGERPKADLTCQRSPSGESLDQGSSAPNSRKSSVRSPASDSCRVGKSGVGEQQSRYRTRSITVPLLPNAQTTAWAGNY
jgi:hypothetical protein